MFTFTEKASFILKLFTAKNHWFLRAIIHKPKFIIIDDLSSHLDDDTVNSIITKLELLRSRDNTSYVIFQHNLNRLAIHSAKSYEIVEKNIVNLNS